MTPDPIDLVVLQTQRTAETPETLNPLLRNRWSPRALADRDISPDDLRTLLDAARWAASCNNEQPWRFIVARRNQKEQFASILGCLVEANQAWAQRASALMLTLTSTKFARNGSLNNWAHHDVGLALGNLMIQAVSMGLVSHGMAGFDAVKARETFGIPEDIVPVAAVAIGYLGDPNVLSEKHRAAELGPRSRKPLADLLFASEIA